MIKIYELACTDCTRGTVLETCPTCNGSGRRLAGYDDHDCVKCEGWGEIMAICSFCGGIDWYTKVKKVYPRLNRITFDKVPFWGIQLSYVGYFRNNTGKSRKVRLDYCQFRNMLEAIECREDWVQYDCWLNTKEMQLNFDFRCEG